MTRSAKDKLQYDAEADILYLELGDGKYSHSVRLSDTSISQNPDIDSHILLDVDESGKIIGVEFQAVSDIFKISKRHVESNGKAPIHLIATLAKGVHPVPA
jgi:uncharacterized protein YuzE